jgi:tetratricopeptide (TPR) repeat protein
MGRAAARLGRLHFRRGTPALGLAAIQPVLDSIEPAPPQHGGGLPRVEGTGSSPGQALRCLYAVQALLQGACGDYEGQKAAAERAGDMARSASDERVMALAEYARAAAALHLGDTEDARRALESTVVPLAESAGDLDTLSLAHTGLAFTYLADGAFDESQRHLNAALESAVELGDPVYLAFAHYRLGVSAYLMGDAWEADHHFVQAAQLNHDVTAPWITPYVLAGFALVRALEHRSSEAINCLLQSREAAERTGDLAAHHTLRHILHLQQRHHLGSQESRTRVMAVFRQAGELLRDRIVA